MFEQAILQLTNDSFNEQRVNMPISCVSAQPLLGVINKYKEQPFWMGDSTGSKTKFVLFVNNAEKTWTLVHFVDDKTGCIIGAGNASTSK